MPDHHLTIDLEIAHDAATKQYTATALGRLEDVASTSVLIVPHASTGHHSPSRALRFALESLADVFAQHLAQAALTRFTLNKKGRTE